MKMYLVAYYVETQGYMLDSMNSYVFNNKKDALDYCYTLNDMVTEDFEHWRVITVFFKEDSKTI